MQEWVYSNILDHVLGLGFTSDSCSRHLPSPISHFSKALYKMACLTYHLAIEPVHCKKEHWQIPFEKGEFVEEEKVS